MSLTLLVRFWPRSTPAGPVRGPAHVQEPRHSLLPTRLPGAGRLQDRRAVERRPSGRAEDLRICLFRTSRRRLSRFRAAPVELRPVARANRSKSWRSIATSQENATAFCNDCGGWKRITGREDGSARTPAVSNGPDTRKNRRRGYVAPPLLTERLALSSRGVSRLDFGRQGLSPGDWRETI